MKEYCPTILYIGIVDVVFIQTQYSTIIIFVIKSSLNRINNIKNKK